MTDCSLLPCAASSAQRAGGLLGRIRWRAAVCGLVFGLLATLTATGCNHAAAAKEQKLVEVTVTTPITDDAIEYQDFTGRLDAYKTVEIRARVSGYLTQVPFTEGDLVKKGDLLFQIDPRPYQAQYDQAVTQIALNESTMVLAETTLARDQAAGAASSGAVSPQQLDQDKAAVAEAKARVASSKATVEINKLNLEFARVTAPFDGRISRRNVDPGNVVTADVTLLTTLVTEAPVYAYFDVDERTYLDLRKVAEPSEASWFRPQLQAKVLMRLANEEQFARVGVVNFVDNRVTATTGTIRMRGVFDNAARDLKSGLFARVRMPTSRPYRAFLIPDEAIQRDQDRKFVYLVNDQDEIVYQGGDDLVLGQVIEGLRVVKKGLSLGDRVVITGMQRVKPKQHVTVKTQDPPKKPDSPLRQLMPKAEE